MSRPSTAVVLLVGCISGPGCGTSPDPELASPTRVADGTAQSTAAAPGSVRAASAIDPVTITLQGPQNQSQTIMPENGLVSASFNAIAGGYTITPTQSGTQFTPPLLQNVTVEEGLTQSVGFTGPDIIVLVSITGVSSIPSPPPGCIVPDAVVGGSVNLEGDVVTGSSPSFSLRSNRATADVNVNAGDASYVCLVPVATCPPVGSLGGARVHVRGRLQSCTAASANLVATEVKIKKLP